jgi:histidyl-tRNA synthetase
MHERRKGLGSVQVEPRIFKGTRDFLPADMAVRNRAVGTLRDAFERFGFLPLETPAIELLEVLEGKSGSEEDKLIYNLAYRDGRTLGLRYDLTVPLSRVMAMYGRDLPLPFKRYQIQPVWRADKPQKGRFREFCQCDVDTVGCAEMAADAEIILLVRQAMQDLGFQSFRMTLNHRKIITGVMEVIGVPEAARTAASKAVDKLEKIGRDEVEKLLVSGAEAGLSPARAREFLDAVAPGGSPAKDLERLADLLGKSEAGRAGVAETRELLALVSAVCDDATWLRFSPDMVRGLDYYTGPIFEIQVTEPKIGSLGGGGRYDRLVGELGGGEGFPATGFAFGLERIILALSEGGAGSAVSGGPQVLVTVFSEDLQAEAFRLAEEIRGGGLRVELFVGKPGKMKKQFKTADRKAIPVTAVLGPDEAAGDRVGLKDMRTGEQRQVPRAEAARSICAMLGEGERT